MHCLFLAAAVAGAAGAAASDAPPTVVNAHVETRSAAAGLAPAFHAAVKDARAPAWIGYSVATEGRHQMCCGSMSDEVGHGCPGCRLEGKGSFTVGDESRPAGSTVSLEGDPTVVVLFRAEDGEVGRIRTFSSGCALDAGGLPFVWLTGVRPNSPPQMTSVSSNKPRRWRSVRRSWARRTRWASVPKRGGSWR